MDAKRNCIRAYERMIDRLDSMNTEELDELRRDLEQHDDEGWSGSLLEAVEAEIVARFAATAAMHATDRMTAKRA